jgi:hypothetical protein
MKTELSLSGIGAETWAISPVPPPVRDGISEPLQWLVGDKMTYADLCFCDIEQPCLIFTSNRARRRFIEGVSKLSRVAPTQSLATII